ncbi:putative zinc-binding metallopeptidase [uncultured Bacteroides sp.]|uniref:zinc-binding metallopeptidase n=1 Tax=uncultured Bacteroides sp. TaxID=162156 RepID=UPI0025FD5226|nr:putative zinc-binding metallopeptidase [uncultured Bacteroides sp.]
MKNIKWLFILFAMTALWSCSEEDLDSNSIFGPDASVKNEFDTWLLHNYTEPYNIDFKYRFEDKESNDDYNLAPADYNKAVALAKMTKYLWIESYEELLGPDFIRTYCPKVMHLVGSPAYNSQGSIVLGTAEGGLKITLYNVNAIDLNNIDIETLNYWYFKTMHHEFAHILHQTKNYSTDFNLISASNYQSSSWVNVTDQEALNMGFVSPYASSETQEDFVEIISIYVTHSAAYWNSLVGSASADGQEMINQKLALVKDYLTTTWGIDLDALRDIVQRRSQDVLTMDLTTLN